MRKVLWEKSHTQIRISKYLYAESPQSRVLRVKMRKGEVRVSAAARRHLNFYESSLKGTWEAIMDNANGESGVTRDEVG